GSKIASAARPPLRQGTPFLLGRPPRARLALPRRRHRRSARRRRRWRQILIKVPRLLCRSTGATRFQHPVNKNAPLERDRQHITRPDQMRRLVNLDTVHPDFARLRQLGSKGARLDHAGEEQPLVYALACVDGQWGSYLRNWSRSAASLA